MNERSLLFTSAALAQGFMTEASFLAAYRRWKKTDKENGKETLEHWLVAKGYVPAEEGQRFEDEMQRNVGDEDVAALAIRAALHAVAYLRNPDCIHLIQTSMEALRSQRRPGNYLEMHSRYFWKEALGQGGLGQVWVARDADLDREVAVKLLRDNLRNNEEARRRFVEEARTNGQLEHPNIIPIIQVGQNRTTSELYYAMRLVRGQTLTAAIAEYHDPHAEGWQQSLRLVRLLNAFVSICHAIAYAHSRGVIHRDLKPDNILLGAFGETFVIDWGLSKRLSGYGSATVVPPARPIVANAGSPAETAHGRRLGTPNWMSPEQAAGDSERVGPASDIYGLGAILFAILTNRPPHRTPGATRSAVFEKIVQLPTPTVREFAPTAQPALAAVVAKAMAKAPENRYASALDLAEDVQRWLAGQPVSAFEEPQVQRLARWFLRHRTVGRVFALTLISFMVLSAVLVAVTLQNQSNLETIQLRQLGSQIEVIAGLFAEDFRYLPRLQAMYAHSAVAQSLAQAHLENDAAAERLWKEKFATQLAASAQNSLTVHSISLIDNAGREIVRVHREGEKFINVDGKLLGAMTGHRLFEKAMNAPAGQTEIEIEALPHADRHGPPRVFSMATPVLLDSNHRRAGVLYTVLDESHLFHRIIPNVPHRYVYLTDADGRLLFDPYPDNAAAPLHNAPNVQSVLTGLAPMFSAEPEKAMERRQSSDGRWIVQGRRVPYAAESSFGLVMLYSRHAILGQARVDRSPILAIGTVVLVVAVFLSLVIGRAVVRAAGGE